MSEIQKAQSVTLQALEGISSRLHSAILEHFDLDVHPQLIDFLAGKLYHQLAIDVLATCANVPRKASSDNQLEQRIAQIEERLGLDEDAVVYNPAKFAGRGKPRAYPLTDEDETWGGLV